MSIKLINKLLLILLVCTSAQASNIIIYKNGTKMHNNLKPCTEICISYNINK